VSGNLQEVRSRKNNLPSARCPIGGKKTHSSFQERQHLHELRKKKRAGARKETKRDGYFGRQFRGNAKARKAPGPGEKKQVLEVSRKGEKGKSNKPPRGRKQNKFVYRTHRPGRGDPCDGRRGGKKGTILLLEKRGWGKLAIGKTYEKKKDTLRHTFGEKYWSFARKQKVANQKEKKNPGFYLRLYFSAATWNTPISFGKKGRKKKKQKSPGRSWFRGERLDPATLRKTHSLDCREGGESLPGK